LNGLELQRTSRWWWSGPQQQNVIDEERTRIVPAVVLDPEPIEGWLPSQPKGRQADGVLLPGVGRNWAEVDSW
jgi:hypothetical protein